MGPRTPRVRITRAHGSRAPARRISSAGYIVVCRGARTRRLRLAGVGELTPDEARALARDRLGEVAKGGNPSADRHKARHAATVAEVCDDYLRDAQGRVKASTLAMDRSRIETHVKPLIQARRVVLAGGHRTHEADIAAGKTAKARVGRGGVSTGGRGVAARTVGMLSTILAWATRRRIIPANPAVGMRKFPDGRRRRFLTFDEQTRLGEAMRAAAEAGENPVAIACVGFLLLTGLRRMEALALPWEWVDSQARCIRLGDSKAGFSIRPLGADAARLLDLGRTGGSRWVFCSQPGQAPSGPSRVLDRLCARASLEAVVCTSFATATRR